MSRRRTLSPALLVAALLASSPAIAGDNEWTPLGPDDFSLAARILVDPLAPTTLYVGGLEGVARSLDGGETWELVNSGRAGSAARALVLDTAAPQTLYSGGEGLFKSVDGAGSWTASGLAGVDVTVLDISPASPLTLFAGSDDDVFRSTDGGATWISVGSGLGGVLVTQLRVDPVNPDIVYAGTQKNGLFKTLDGGGTWSQTSLGTLTRVEGIAVAPRDPQVVYVCFDLAGVWKSTDGGGTWSNVGGPLLGDRFFQDVAIDPARPGVVYAGIQIEEPLSPFYVSVDGAATWIPFGPGLEGPSPIGVNSIVSITVDPGSDTLYAGTFDDGIFALTEVPGITITPADGLVTGEDGATDTFSVVLDSIPTADVSLAFASTDESEGLVDPGVTFIPQDALAPQVVEVRGVDDPFVDGDVAYRVTTFAAVSEDGRYASIDPVDLEVVNLDDESSVLGVPALSSLGTALLGVLLLTAALLRFRASRAAQAVRPSSEP